MAVQRVSVSMRLNSKFVEEVRELGIQNEMGVGEMFSILLEAEVRPLVKYVLRDGDRAEWQVFDKMVERWKRETLERMEVEDEQNIVYP